MVADPSGAPARRPTGVVLAYHRIARHDRDPFCLNVAPDCFGHHLEVVRRNASVVPLEALLGRGGDSSPRVALTFDDGYADLLSAAQPLLERFAVPATAFVVAGALASSREFWWDRLERALLEPVRLPSRLCLTVRGIEHEFEIAAHPYSPDSSRWREWVSSSASAPSPRHALLQRLVAVIRGVSDLEKHEQLDVLEAWAELQPAVRPTHRALDSAELQRAAETIAVGAHTVTHPRLADLPAGEQAWELRESRRRLEASLGRAVDAFAYPHGGREDFTPETVALVRSAGYRLACANFPGDVGEATDRFELPRHMVYDWSAVEFEPRLRAWLAGA